MPCTPHDFRLLVDRDGTRFVECPVLGDHLTGFPILNKGTAFDERERDELELRGLLPPHVSTIEEQVGRVLFNYRQKSSDVEKYVQLVSLLDRNETLFYRVILENLREMLPIIYTPTVGAACRAFGRLYRRGRGMYLTIDDMGRIPRILGNWPFRRVRVIVVTDGERILGLGDLGANGMGIPVGKLNLYVAAGGIRPWQVLPICLDVGTTRQELLEDPLYLGVRRRRVRGGAYDALLDEFVSAASRLFPGVLIQFEDFATANAFRLLERHRDNALCFNDDIQGTGAVALATLLASERRTGRSLGQERIVLAGAGNAAVGIADLIVAAARARGVAPDDMRRSIWMTDVGGLLVKSRDDLGAHHRAYVRDEARMPLEDVVRSVRPTVLIGVSGQGGLFSSAVLGGLGDDPLVMPLSNPTSAAECTPEEALAATGGRALVATGSPFAETTQCNNVYVFPGIGLGLVASRARRAPSEVFLVAAHALAAMASDDELAQGRLLPGLSSIRDVSLKIARAVAGAHTEIEQWTPEYLPYRRAPGAQG